MGLTLPDDSPPPSYSLNAPKKTSDPYWYTGYSGTKPKTQSGGVYFGLQPGSPAFGATQTAFNQKNDDYEKALAALRAGQFMPEGTPNAAMSMFTNPKGFDPKALQARMAALADLEGGSRMNALDNLEKIAAARGFRNSVGVLDAGARLRASSAANLMRSQNDVFYEGEKAKLQQQGISGGLLGTLSASEAAMLRALAGAHQDRPRDVIPGISDQEGGNGGFRFIDPRTGQVIFNPPGGWSQADYEAMQRERVQWEYFHGGQAA